MIKLTGLNYKIRPESLERFHNLSEYSEARMFEWEAAMGMAESIGGNVEYIDKPFIEPQDFKETDYSITEKPLRIKSSDIIYYTENTEKITEITIDTKTGVVTFSVKETVEEIDDILSI